VVPRSDAVAMDEGECWSAVVGRDTASGGRFVYAVVTTGIYRRPSCPTPTPLRRNVRFFSDIPPPNRRVFARASAAGRPSSRLSHGTWPLSARLAQSCARDRAPSLATLAAAVGVSCFHFHRIFKEVLGTTPGEYAKAVRWRRLAENVEAGRPVVCPHRVL
jgi:AraC family transcriptional regulator of adaptative response/methylated-DNA-[protein]-cysteine methyltransferase